MDDVAEAWRLWHLLQALSDTLWERYESAFMDFCGEQSGRAEKRMPVEEELPF